MPSLPPEITCGATMIALDLDDDPEETRAYIEALLARLDPCGKIIMQLDGIADRFVFGDQHDRILRHRKASDDGR